MVASRLLEVTNKGTEWVYGTGGATSATGTGTGATASAVAGTNTNTNTNDAAVQRLPPPITAPATTPTPTNNPSYMDYANQSFQFATDTTYSTLASVVSSLYKGGGSTSSSSMSDSSSHWLPSTSYITQWLPSTNTMFSLAKTWTIGDSTEVPYAEQVPYDADRDMASPRSGSASTGNSAGGPSPRRRAANTIGLSSILQNPYNSVRGRHHHPSSMSAVRSLITLVPFDDDGDGDGGADEKHDAAEFNESGMDSRLGTVKEEEQYEYHGQGEVLDDDTLPPGLETSWTDGPRDRTSRQRNQQRRTTVSSAETASQLAEGTLRALRDMALDEAVELHQALHFWSDRWERPILSWLEAGPAGTYMYACVRYWLCKLWVDGCLDLLVAHENLYYS
jgi:hypothetical protein